MAQIHQEIYRRFEGELRKHPFRFWPVLTAGIRANCKKKLPLLILYAPATIATVIFSFVVYAKFAAQEQMDQIGTGEGLSLQESLGQAVAIGMIEQLLEVRVQVIGFNEAMSFFALFTVAWFGSGLLCEDRRVGAHQLYFARPLTRIDYFLGKFLIAAFFAALAMVLPVQIICLVASWSSPDWAFLREEGDVIWRALAFGSVWTVVTCSLTLCASSLFPRRSFALAGLIGFSMILEALSHILAEVIDQRLLAASPLENLLVVSSQLFGHEYRQDIDPETSWIVLIWVVVAALLVTTFRLRRLEVVA